MEIVGPTCQMLVLNLPLSQMLKYSKCMWENWHSRDGDIGAMATHHTHIWNLGQLQLLLSTCYCRCCLPVLPCIPQKANTASDLQHPHPHAALKRDEKVFNLCLQVDSGKQAPTDLTNGFASACACVCGPYGNISGHIMHFIAIEKNMFMCRSERKDLDIVCAMFGR